MTASPTRPVSNAHAEALHCLQNPLLFWQIADIQRARVVVHRLANDYRMNEAWRKLDGVESFHSFSFLASCALIVDDLMMSPRMTPSKHQEHYKELAATFRAAAAAAELDRNLSDLSHPFGLDGFDGLMTHIWGVLDRSLPTSGRTRTSIKGERRFIANEALAVTLFGEIPQFVPGVASCLSALAERAEYLSTLKPVLNKPNHENAARTFFMTRLKSYLRGAYDRKRMKDTVLNSTVAVSASVLFDQEDVDPGLVSKIGIARRTSLRTKSRKTG